MPCPMNDHQIHVLSALEPPTEVVLTKSPLVVGLSNRPSEVFHPSLGSNDRDYSISVSSEVQDPHVSFQRGVDPLGSFLSSVVFDHVALLPASRLGDVKGLLEVSIIHVEVYCSLLSVPVFLLSPEVGEVALSLNGHLKTIRLNLVELRD